MQYIDTDKARTARQTDCQKTIEIDFISGVYILPNKGIRELVGFKKGEEKSGWETKEEGEKIKKEEKEGKRGEKEEKERQERDKEGKIGK